MRNLGNNGIILLKNGDMSLDLTASNQIVNAIIVTIQAVWEGAGAAGTMSIAYSNDNVTFSLDANSTQTISGPGDFMWDISNIGANYVQFIFDPNEGGSSGSVTVSMNYKGI